jgi:hypothetical protein
VYSASSRQVGDGSKGYHIHGVTSEGTSFLSTQFIVLTYTLHVRAFTLVIRCEATAQKRNQKLCRDIERIPQKITLSSLT